MEKKYKLSKETFTMNSGKPLDVNFVTMYRIIALKDFGDVKKGDIGGFIQKESNLSQEGNCWIYDDATICGEAKIYGNAQVRNNAHIDGYASIYGNAKIYDYADINGHSLIYDEAEVHDHSSVCGVAEVFENAKIYGNSNIFDRASVYGNANIDNTVICSNAQINVDLSNNDNYIVISPVGHRKDTITFIKNDKGIHVNAFLYSGSLYKFKQQRLEALDPYNDTKNYMKLINNIQKIL